MVQLTTPETSSPPKRPNEKAIAFAASVVLSKPEDLSIREYIRLLRQHIANGRRENAISSVYRHLDRASWWRAQYERTKDALRVAEGYTVDLQREIEKLKGQLEQAKRPSMSAPKKRKKALDEDVIPVPRSPKRARRDGSSSQRIAATEFGKDFDFAEAGVSGNILMRSIFQVQQALKCNDRAEPAVLAHHLVQTASSLVQVVLQMVNAYCASNDSSIASLKDTLTSTGRVATMLVVGITRLALILGGPEVQGRVVYAYVHMFDDLTSLLDTLSVAEMARKSAQEATASTTQCSATSKGKAKAARPKQPNVKDIASLNAVTTLLCSIIVSINRKSEVHKQLFEGLAYCVLNKLGARLYTCVFGRPRAPTIEEEIVVGVTAKDDQLLADETSSPTSDEVRQATLEAPYLIHLLQRLIVAAPAYMGSLTSKITTSKSKAAALKNASKANLAIHARERLQRTLINCIFGTEGVEADDPLMECLRMPGCIGTGGSGLGVPKVKEVDVQSWFQEEVWRMVGWEVLGREGGW
ncbi:hypothetical protein LTR62_007179 [Meristemomyces frigidus]|uniref:Uncharacterized protein n=1 Tax=Meristemomyces frigidus TaxID=1508187 RepID=A0AAN7YDU0_9PEZI|nr:hypothetical protein LTR62_007179 [Meristemomyces frigidus]